MSESGNAVPMHRWRGRKWRVAVGGRTAVVDDSVGMRYLALLLASPDTEIPALDLAGARSAAAVSAQPVLDDVAIRGYRHRLAWLRRELDEPTDGSDLGHRVRLQMESDWLVAELAAATGLGGRQRRFADDAERARIAVGKAIRRALRRIEAADQALGADLRACVVTGLRCCYRPQVTVPTAR